MLNQLIRHKCLSVIFPPLPGMGRCQQHGAAEPMLPGGDAWAARGPLGIKLHSLAVPLVGGCGDRARGVPEVAWDWPRGCSAAAGLGPEVGFVGGEWRFCCLRRSWPGNRCLVLEMLSAPGD